MAASVLKQDPNKKGSKERLFIMTRIHNMQIFGEIPFVKRSFEPFGVWITNFSTSDLNIFQWCILNK